MSKKLIITFDADVPQSQRFEIEQKLDSAGWIAGGKFKPSDTFTAKKYDYIEAYWTSDADAPIPDCPPGCHVKESV